MRKLAVIFPGIGYTADKPLLYFSRRLAVNMDYEILSIAYCGFPDHVFGDPEKLAKCYQIALSQSEAQLSAVDWAVYDDILFIGKSIGTVIAAEICDKSSIRDRIRMVLYTPMEDTFRYALGETLVFTGDNDPWVGRSASKIPALCEKQNIPYHVIPGANHSLECGIISKDMEMLQSVMLDTERFLGKG